MVQVDVQNRELTIKLVYYGPALSGKTTNLRELHARVAKANRSRLLTLDTANDRTLFFDLLPIHFRAQSGLAIKVKLYTVPGQVMHNSTRKVVLQGADGVAFIADSQLSERQANNESYANLKQNLRDNGMDPAEVPVVIQFNKRDLPSIRTDEEIERLAQKGREPIYKAVALRGEGVVATFLGLAQLTWDDLERRLDLSGKFGLRGEDFMAQLRRLFGAP